jgi:hypothetical protein
MASLAKKLDVKSPSLYNHIGGLPDLRNKLAVYGLVLLYDELKSQDTIQELGKAYVNFVRNHPGVYEATLVAQGPGNSDIQAAGEPIVKLCVQALAPYGLEEKESLHLVRGLRSILHGFASLEQKGGFGLPLDLDESIQVVLDTYMAGMEKKHGE